ncbi:MAG: hypothetical protein EPN97_12700 [Alphaproteobacteria bacterium]|nr:MAG: hypothetical protein EPN97_12700 [Alphaproteobacteria bacterium]
MSKTPAFDEIKRAILASLSPDLLEKKYREQLSPDDPPETGHCAVASEAFYHIAGGRKAGFIPVVCGYAADGSGKMKFGAEKTEALKNPAWHKETHWWVRGPKDGKRGQGRLFDVTVRQYPDPFPYENGHNTGFMQPQQKPSRRAQVVIDRVTELLGADALRRYRDANIAACRAVPAKSLKFKL